MQDTNSSLWLQLLNYPALEKKNLLSELNPGFEFKP